MHGVQNQNDQSPIWICGIPYGSFHSSNAVMSNANSNMSVSCNRAVNSFSKIREFKAVLKVA